VPFVRLVTTHTGLVLCLLAATGCAGTPAEQPSTGSGDSGLTTIDAGCPVVRATPCPTEPLRARVVALREGSTAEAGSAESDARGRFRLALAPGRYLLRPENLTGAPVPTALPITIVVPRDGFVDVTISFDSGVRGPA
jgi:hypothetical protein